MAIWTSYRN